ncbi:hypothetical protein [Alicyclobacillus sp. SP_1]|uniref:hypothetical protein n=1 Tax=Alicyclobacillus sp. SP_1 TaxID=2942475 RepID=UPI0021586578|nr:hypothetical protein [Alicyclobacillus sp. SP_1]
MEWTIAKTWSKFVYPFIFPANPAESCQAQYNKLIEYLVRNQGEHQPWVEKAFEAHELDNMLPYVKQYLRLPSNHSRFVLDARVVAPDDVFFFEADCESETETIRFSMSSIELYLFFNGVGFVSIEVRPPSSSVLSDGSPHAAAVTSSVSPAEWTVEDIERLNSRVASLSRGEIFVGPRGRRQTVGEMLKEILSPLQNCTSCPTYIPMVDRFLPVYGAILLRAKDQNVPERDSMEAMDEEFFQFAQSHLTILRKTFTPNNISHFSQIHLNDMEHHYMPYHNVIHTQSLDGGFVLAYDNGLRHFSGEHPPSMDSFRTNYFYMMLIPYHQRTSILRYAMEAADAALAETRGAMLRQLREEIYDFTSRCYFSQASVSEERDRLYRRWQSAFNITQMYNELKEEVHDIDNYLADVERARERELRNASLARDNRNMALFSFITLVFLPISLVLQFAEASPELRAWMRPEGGFDPLILALVLLALFGAAIFYLIARFVRRR